MTGWIVSIYSVTNTLGNIAAGVVLDKFGRRIPLAIGLSGPARASFCTAPSTRRRALGAPGVSRTGRLHSRAGHFRHDGGHDVAPINAAAAWPASAP